MTQTGRVDKDDEDRLEMLLMRLSESDEDVIDFMDDRFKELILRKKTRK